MSDRKECIYCGKQKELSEFSFEHIWPSGLGGSYLGSLWQTRNVCRICNSVSGVFVDGAFIKSATVSQERTRDALSYLSADNPKGILPLHFLGTVENVEASSGEVIDYWLSHGANILHLREDGDDLWSAYAGGDPRRASKKARAGRVLVQLTSDEPYWICVALASVRAHFPKAERFLANLELPKNATAFRELDPHNEAHKDDLRIVEDFNCLQRQGQKIRGQLCVSLESEGRFLAKVALGVGYNLFGEEFLATSYGQELRKAFREAQPEKRRVMDIRGTGYWAGTQMLPPWPGGWLLALLPLEERLALMVTVPSGRTMVVQVTDDAELLERLGSDYQGGLIWVVVPPAGCAEGPLSLPDYLAHMTDQRVIPELQSLNELRCDPSTLPPVRGVEQGRS